MDYKLWESFSNHYQTCNLNKEVYSISISVIIKDYKLT